MPIKEDTLITDGYACDIIQEACDIASKTTPPLSEANLIEANQGEYQLDLNHWLVMTKDGDIVYDPETIKSISLNTLVLNLNNLYTAWLLHTKPEISIFPMPKTMH